MKPHRHPERLLATLIMVAYPMCLIIGLLAIALAIEHWNSERPAEGVVIVALGVLVSGFLVLLLRGLALLVEMARVGRYRADRDEELFQVLSEVRGFLRTVNAPSSPLPAADKAPSAVFRSSLMPFTPPEGDSALTALRPSIDK